MHRYTKVIWPLYIWGTEYRMHYFIPLHSHRLDFTWVIGILKVFMVVILCGHGYFCSISNYSDPDHQA